VLPQNVNGLRKAVPEAGFAFEPLRRSPSPQVDLTGVPAPRHITESLLSHFPRANRSGSLMLDLGCGNATHRGVGEHAGFQYVGLDYSAAGAPMLGDAQVLPFKDNCFEFVLSVAVLEHIRYPFLMTKEAFRVLEPGGSFVGTVAFLEPFHGDSLYHHTHLGIYNALKAAGFDIQLVAPDPKWSGLTAQARLALFPGMPEPLADLMALPLHLTHRLWWRLANLASGGRKAHESRRVLWNTGAFTFVAVKPNSLF